MDKLRTFFHVLKGTFTSPSYYGDILKSKFTFSLKFFYFYFFIYALVGTIYIIPKLAPLKNYLLVFPSKLEKLFPNNLEITIAGGEISTNMPEPYYLPISDIEKIFSEEKVLGAQTPKAKNLIVIDTRATVEDFTKYETLALITKKSIVMFDKDTGGYKVIPAGEIPDMKINRIFIQNILFRLNPFIAKAVNYLIPVLAVMFFWFLLVFLPVSKFFYLLIFSVIMLFIGRLVSFPVPYKKCYQLGMHLIIIPTTIFGIFSLFGLNPTFPYLQTIIMIALAYVVLVAIKKDESAYLLQKSRKTVPKKPRKR